MWLTIIIIVIIIFIIINIIISSSSSSISISARRSKLYAFSPLLLTNLVVVAVPLTQDPTEACWIKSEELLLPILSWLFFLVAKNFAKEYEKQAMIG